LGATVECGDTINKKAFSFLKTYMVIISIYFRTGNTVSFVAF